jgi:hypothetical protein
MRPLSSLELILLSILAFVLGMGISHAFRHSNKQNKHKNKEDHTTYVFERENGVRYVHTHTKWIGDSIIIENDTTFIKHK